MFFFPYRDDNPHNTTPIVTWCLIALCVIIFLWQQGLDSQAARLAVLSYGIIPADLFGLAEIDPMIAPLPAWMTIVTSMFLHGGWMHLLGNMLYLWIFGDNVEASMGRLRFILFYLSCGAVAALAQSVATPSSTIPMIGASGAIAGVAGAYLMLYPHANIRVFFIFIIFFTVMNVPAWIVLGLWFVGQVLSQAASVTGQGGVAFLAHISGFIAGAILIFKLRLPDVPMFSRPLTRAFTRQHARIVAPRASSRRSGGSVPPSGPSSKGPWN
ncbi:MAG: rhomboid family intramembrane serine protease [Rhodospirillaceae bacterium]